MQCGSEQLAVDDEAGAFRDLVVQALRGGVGLMCLPVNPRRARVLGAFIHAMDQRRPHALAAGLLADT